MQCLKFDIYGRYAHFKNPENNNNVNFSFEHIHKPALLGIIGCILGLNGRSSNKDTIEYYEILKNIRVSIVPQKPIFNKYLNEFINCTGYANAGLPQQIRMMMLQNPRWTIYITKDSMDEYYYNKLFMLLSSHQSTFPPYLGNNSCNMKVANVEEVRVDKINDNAVNTIDSLFNYNIVTSIEKISQKEYPKEVIMYLPVKLNEKTRYIYDKMIYTDYSINVNNTSNLYKYYNKVLYFI